VAFFAATLLFTGQSFAATTPTPAPTRPTAGPAPAPSETPAPEPTARKRSDRAQPVPGTPKFTG
jgi:hypothetical protein